MIDNAAAQFAARAKHIKADADRFLNSYRFGIREIETKLAILSEDFQLTHEYNPIESISSRLKSVDSIIEKASRKGIDLDRDDVRDHIVDIAGVRITCSFVTDTYRLFELLAAQTDLNIREVKDYIANPKPNGYKSLHAIIDVPIFLTTGEELVPVEVQFRTIAMDFWASLEHKIFYKYDRVVPERLLEDLTDAAHAASELDERMQRLHREIHGAPAQPVAPLPEMSRQSTLSA